MCVNNMYECVLVNVYVYIDSMYVWIICVREVYLYAYGYVGMCVHMSEVYTCL